MTELFTSSGNSSFSTPADAECIHFKFVKCGQMSCIACKASNIEPMLVTQTMGYINSSFTCSSCLLDASLPVPHFKSTCTFSQSDFVQSASSLQQWYIRMREAAACTDDLAQFCSKGCWVYLSAPHLAVQYPTNVPQTADGSALAARALHDLTE